MHEYLNASLFWKTKEDDKMYVLCTSGSLAPVQGKIMWPPRGQSDPSRVKKRGRVLLRTTKELSIVWIKYN